MKSYQMDSGKPRGVLALFCFGSFRSFLRNQIENYSFVDEDNLLTDDDWYIEENILQHNDTTNIDLCY